MGRSGGGSHSRSGGGGSFHRSSGSSRSHSGGGGSFRSSSRSSSGSAHSTSRSSFGSSRGHTGTHHAGSGGSAPAGCLPVGCAPRGCGCGTVLGAIVLLMVISVFFCVIGFVVSDPLYDTEVTPSTYARQKLTGTGGYRSMVTDEIDWFSRPSRVADGLRAFYDATGVQPVVYLENRPDLIGDTDAQDAETERIFDALDLGTNDFLFVYFDDDGTDGDWMTRIGNTAGTVMDQEAVRIFGDYLERYWYSDVSEEDLFIRTYQDTAKRIMSRTTNSDDVVVWALIALIAATAAIFITALIRARRRAERERAEETARILGVPLEDLADNDPLLRKYTDAE